MNTFRHVIRRAAVGLIPAALLSVAGLLPATEDRAAFGQDLSSTPLSQEDNTEPDATDLDSLLEAADKDVTQLSSVSVASPALATEVSTVSRQESTVGRSAAPVFVITNEMIRRSGARTIPDILRMVPGVQVARIDASKWAVSIRGFNGRFANKLLVQIDGRSVYTPLFGGVWWDVQDVVLEDVERIEVIRGPGATVWGANAVNGIINIITKKASDTQGTYVHAGAGTEDLGFTTARYGGRIGNDAHYRVYGKWFERDEGFATGDNAKDDWRMGRGGFRTDWTPSCCDTLTLQGDYYKGAAGERNLLPSLPPVFTQAMDDDEFTEGGNILFRWRRELTEDSDWSLQLYYDRTERLWSNLGMGEDRDTFDLDFQHRFPLGHRHSIIWGLGYRNTKDQIRNADVLFGAQPIISFSPNARVDDVLSYFIQDEITLREDLLYFTVGSKFEHNDYTGFEFQPTARLLWTPSPRHSIWASISRAVRTPTRTEDDIRLLMAPVVVPPGGTRIPRANRQHQYGVGGRDRLRGRHPGPADRSVFLGSGRVLQPVRQPAVNRFRATPGAGTRGLFDLAGVFENDGRAQSYGFEIAGTYEITPHWRLYGTYSFLVITGETGADMNSPRNQIYLQSSWDLCRNVQFDMVWRYVDSVPGFGLAGTVGPGVPNYNVMDMRLAWHARPGLELAVVGRSLLDLQHLEAPTDSALGTVSTEVQAEVYGSVTWRY